MSNLVVRLTFRIEAALLALALALPSPAAASPEPGRGTLRDLSVQESQPKRTGLEEALQPQAAAGLEETPEPKPVPTTSDAGVLRFQTVQALRGFLAQRRPHRASHPEREGGTHFVTYLYPELSLVEKVVKRKAVMESVALARDRMGGLTVGFVVDDTEEPEHLFMESVPSLKVVLEQRVAAGDLDGAGVLLRKFFERTMEIIRRGVLNWDSKIENFGVTPSGEVVLLDLGGLVDVESALQEPDTEESSLEFFYLKMGEGIPAPLADRYHLLRNEFGFANGGDILRTVQANRGAEAPRAVDWTPTVVLRASGLKELGRPGTPTQRRAVLIGGVGNIGRGHIAALLAADDFDIIFADFNQALIGEASQRDSYVVTPVGVGQPVTVRNFWGIDAQGTEAVAAQGPRADWVFTTVGTGNIIKLTDVVYRYIRRRIEAGHLQTLNIVFAENLPVDQPQIAALRQAVLDMAEDTATREYVEQKVNFIGSGQFRSYVDGDVGWVGAVVNITVPPTIAAKSENPLDIAVEGGGPYYLEVDAKELRDTGFIPSGLRPVENIRAAREKKLLIHNMGHATLAYLCAALGIADPAEGMKDPRIAKVVRQAMRESAQGLHHRYPGLFPLEGLDEYIAELADRFANVELGDTVERIARDPLRKLQENDRLFGAAQSALEAGVAPEAIGLAIAAAIRYARQVDKIGEKDLAPIMELVHKHGRKLPDSDPAFQAELSRLSGLEEFAPLEPEAARAQIRQLAEAMRAGREAGFQRGAVVDLRGLPPEKRVVFVGDMHAYGGVLSRVIQREGLEDENVIFVVTGDAVHPEEPARRQQMDSSVGLMQHLMALKIRHPARVYYLLGNHDRPTLTTPGGKDRGPFGLGAAYFAELRQRYGEDYVRAYEQFLTASPILLVADRLVAVHSGPILRASLEQIRDVDMSGVLRGRDEMGPILDQAMNGVRERYYADSVQEFLRNLGLPEEAVILTSHFHGPTHWWHQKLLVHTGVPALENKVHNIYAGFRSAQGRWGYARYQAGRLEIVKFLDGEHLETETFPAAGLEEEGRAVQAEPGQVTVERIGEEVFGQRLPGARWWDGAEGVYLATEWAASHVRFYLGHETLRPQMETWLRLERAKLPEGMEAPRLSSLPDRAAALRAPGLVVKDWMLELPYAQQVVPVFETELEKPLPSLPTLVLFALKGAGGQIEAVIGVMRFQDAQGNTVYAYFV